MSDVERIISERFRHALSGLDEGELLPLLWVYAYVKERVTEFDEEKELKKLRDTDERLVVLGRRPPTARKVPIPESMP